jgi:hypothetical protein
MLRLKKSRTNEALPTDYADSTHLDARNPRNQRTLVNRPQLRAYPPRVRAARKIRASIIRVIRVISGPLLTARDYAHIPRESVPPAKSAYP